MHINLHKSLLLLAAIATSMAINASTDEIKESYISPTRIVWMSDNSGEFIKGADNLLKLFCGQVAVADPVSTELRSTDNHTASILLDFGKEIHGGIEISSAIRDSQKQVKIHLCFGESVTEALSSVADGKNPYNATNEHSLRDFDAFMPWLGSVRFGNTGFRFVRIDLLDTDMTYTLRHIRAIARERDIPYLGSFECSDKRLNEIWQTGAYTVKLNMQEYLWDGIKRDRLVWAGDMNPEVMAINTVFGANEVVNKSLDFSVDDTPLPGWMNGMCPYSLWWLINQWQVYLYQGNKEYLEKNHEYIKGLVKQISKYIKPDGTEALYGGTRFLDWPTSENPEVIHSGLQGLTVLAMNAAAEIGKSLGDKELEELAKGDLRRLRKVKVDGYGNSQAISMKVLAGISQDEKKDVQKLLDNGVEAFSTFFGYYMLEAIAKGGKYEEGMEMISKYWGAMLDLGATTFWEELVYTDALKAGRIDEIVPEGKFDIHAHTGKYCYIGLRHSLCHGWSAGPTIWLTRHVLGIYPTEPGCKTLVVEPHLGNLEYAKGTFPTPYGVVTVSHTKNKDGKVISKIDSPKQITVILK